VIEAQEQGERLNYSLFDDLNEQVIQLKFDLERRSENVQEQEDRAERAESLVRIQGMELEIHRKLIRLIEGDVQVQSVLTMEQTLALLQSLELLKVEEVEE
jgi:hypothetical protein